MATTFWSDRFMEPKRKFRWIARFGQSFQSWVIKKVNKPSFKISEASHKYLNHTFYYPGRVEWEKVTITMIDPVTPDAASSLMEWMKATGYQLPENRNETHSISKTKAIVSPVYITQLGPDNEEIEKWELVNAWISNIKFGDLDYEGEEMVEIEVEIRYDYAKLNNNHPVRLFSNSNS